MHRIGNAQCQTGSRLIESVCAKRRACRRSSERRHGAPSHGPAPGSEIPRGDYLLRFRRRGRHFRPEFILDAMLSGAIGTVNESVVMIFEATRDCAVIVPLMISNPMSFFIASRLQKQPIFKSLARQDGAHVHKLEGILTLRDALALWRRLRRKSIIKTSTIPRSHWSC